MLAIWRELKLPLEELERPLAEPAGDGGALHALEPAQLHRAGHERAGVAGGNDGVGLFGADEFDGAEQRRILLFADGFERLVVHRQHFAGVDDFDAAVGEMKLPPGGFNVGFATDQKNRLDAGIRFEC